jgi:hypothetical protein
VSHDAALQLMSHVMNAVEDELSGVPYDPGRSHLDGRLYPPSEEFEVASDIAGSRCYRQRGHKTYISPSGAIRISRLDGQMLTAKPAADGTEV